MCGFGQAVRMYVDELTGYRMWTGDHILSNYTVSKVWKLNRSDFPCSRLNDGCSDDKLFQQGRNMKQRIL
jgi:hypothetical protein